MAYPASTVTLGRTMDEIDTTMLDLKSICVNASATMAAGNVAAGLVIGMRQRMIQTKARFNVLKAVPGIAAYAQVQKGNATLDVAAEFVTVLAAIDAVVANITATFPVSTPDSYLLREKWPVNGDAKTIEREFTPSATATLRAKLADVIAAIA